MAEVSIGSAIAKLEADTQRVRGQGLEELKDILRKWRSASQSDAFPDDGFHKVFELLYRIVSKEKPVFLRATKPTSKSNATSRLEVAAAALRLTVEAGAAQIRFKTALSVLDHIVDTLPTADGSLCEPLKNDYLKSFRTILEYPPHVEHMRHKQWQNYVDFAIAALSPDVENGAPRSDMSSSRETSVAPRSSHQLSLRVSQRSGQGTGKETASHSEQIVWALKSLTSVASAPIMSRAEAIAESIQQFLGTATRGQETAFETLNNIVFVSLSEDIAFTQALISDLSPIMRRLWSTRSPLLREQMLITLFTCRYLFLAKSEPWSSFDPAKLEPLLNTILSEYRTRNERDILHFEEMQLVLAGENSHLQLRQFQPMRTSGRALSSWLTLSVTACVILGLSRQVRPVNDTGSPGEGPRKRQKVQTHLAEVLELAVEGSGQEKLVGLQLLLFLFDQPRAVDLEWIPALLGLLPDLNHEDGTIQSWVFLVFARLAVHEGGSLQSSPDLWLQIWEAGRRALSSASSARAAAFALDVLLSTGLLGSSIRPSTLESTLFGGGNNGPSSLTDTTLVLLTSALRSDLFENDRQFESFAVKVIGWLTLRWTLPSNLDRLHNSHMATHARPGLLYLLLSAICGISHTVILDQDWSPAHSIFEATLVASTNLDFLHYLLSLPPRPSQRQESLDNKHRQLDESTVARMRRAVVNFLTGRLRDFLQAWRAIAADRISNIGNDIVEILTIASTVSSALWILCNQSSSESEAPALWSESRNVVSQFVLDQKTSYSREMVARVCGCILSVHTHLSQAQISNYQEEYQAIIEYGLQLARHSSTLRNEDDPSDLEFFDSDPWSSQASQKRSSSPSFNLSRLELPLSQDLLSLLARYDLKLATALQVVRSHGTLDPASTALVVAEILSLDSASLLAARGAVQDFLNIRTGITRADAHLLLERLGQCYLEQELFERCEAAWCFCLGTMQRLMELWANNEDDDDLTTVSYEIYEWFLNTALGKGIASPRVLAVMADMLDSLLRVNASYASEDLVSPRTSLLKILRESDVSNKYRLADKLSRIFEQFVLSEHEAIFDDIVGNLPTDPDNIEGIAVRLHIVAQLGARWHTVLRQATYNLFETVANVPLTATLAHDCILRTCQALGLRRPRELFNLFSPQIFYTWLAKESLARVPFRAFEYNSMKELALDNISELTGQIALRGFSHAEELTQLVARDWNSLLTEEFATAEAYTLSSETSLPKHDRLYDGSEKLVRNQLGSELYLMQLRVCLPDIIAQLIISLQDDRGIEKSLPRTCLASWEEMHTYSSQTIQLPFSQQPSFRAKCLPDELKYLCARLDLRVEDIWTPALLAHVYRQLLDKARPALGPLHICSIIRKIRIVISLAGTIALEGYPLEMLLHNLRPYVTLFDCAEDTMSIYRYLLRQGISYLASRPSFIAGLGVAIFASLTGFITSSQDSTTQESRFRSTMTKAEEFRIFLGQFLESIKPSNSTDESLQTFKQIVRLAMAITQPGSSVKSTNEGSLLYALLTDKTNTIPLLSEMHFDLSIEILCRNFSMSSDLQDDILADDNDAAKFAPILRSLLRKLRVNREFRIWAAQGIGRGYIMRGLSFSVGRQTKPGLTTIFSRDQDLKAVSSYSNMVRYLVELLWKSGFPASTFAERTLQLISSALNEATEHEVLEPDFDRAFVDDLRFKYFPCPRIPSSSLLTLGEDISMGQGTDGSWKWAADLLIKISEEAASDPVLGFIKPLVSAVPESADMLLPSAVHLVLLSELDTQQAFREHLSHAFSNILQPGSKSAPKARQLVLKVLLYLRKCYIPGEAHMAQRNSWLEIDFGAAAAAASRCQMWHEALLFLELHYSQSHLQSGRVSRRSLAMIDDVPARIVSEIYENVDDPDFFYGKHQDLDLQSVIGKMSHEGASQKSLSFQSAILDSHLRMNEQDEILGDIARSTATTLSAANMHGISEAVKQYYEGFQQVSSSGKESTFGQWDLQPTHQTVASEQSLESLFRAMHNASTKDGLTRKLDQSLLDLADAMTTDVVGKGHASILLSKLAVLAEARQIVGATTAGGLDSIYAAILERNASLKLAEFERLSPILLGRETTFAALRRNPHLQVGLHLTLHQALFNEIRITRQSLEVASNYEASQFCLNRAMYLSELNKLATKAGLSVDAAIQYDLARTLWAQDEVSGSIGILQDLRSRGDSEKQAIAVTRADILANLGQKIADARLEKPDEIIDNYLIPAFKELHGRGTGVEAGRVFHNFAAFCDMQLQDTDNLDDFTRISKIRDRKLHEVLDLEKMYKSTRDENKRMQLKGHVTKAKNWFKLDEEEWQRVSQNREKLILQCLENYLLSMRASDEYPNDTLRFLALWLNQAESPTANASVRKHISSVPSLKFAPLVNQLSSRLLDTSDAFQQLLLGLMFRICSDHPYHSLYQIFATSKYKGSKADEVAHSRSAAATKLADLVTKKSTSSAVWFAIHNASIQFHRVAQDRLSEKELKTGAKIPLRKLASGQKLEQMLTESSVKIPPPTMNIALRADRDYASVPTFSKFDSMISIAGGVSAPKIATIIASDGSRHKMLLKGGNDDLRQDAIMEQVFEQVSNLLKDHRATRQRNLGIRTYKVIPLTTNSGIIEFVKDTVPLHEYLLPAHTRYFPKDYKPNRCRKEIADAQTKPLQQRVQAYRNVVANFHPVMRFFFMERFLDPDDWFSKRLNYSRSTAAVSILGHVLGLGDRHGHNILLDEHSGEVVHIDLGVAFETGRVLPVPEVVPFRLTRDLVDGMGLTGVEGVFRRCCNFTLEALRRDQEAIMTILDVLRYDPLHSWSISPLRLQKMQENNEQAEATSAAAAASTRASTPLTSAAADPPSTAAGVVAGRREVTDEPSEADRALTVVAKKLSKSLSVEATVNELIRQATDERNLAVLYCGWAAYA